MLTDLFNNLKKKILGNDGGLMLSELEDMAYRKKLSDYLPWDDYLPWAAYDSLSFIYMLTDDCIGSAWQCQPLYFADEKSLSTLEGLFRVEVPDGTVIQFIMNGTHHIREFMELFMSKRTRKDTMSQRTIKEIVDYYSNAARGGAQRLGGLPFRDFQLYVTLKIPEGSMTPEQYRRMATSFEERLLGAGLSPVNLDPGRLLDWMRKLLNVYPSPNNYLWDQHNLIRKQAIFSHTAIEKQWDKIILGQKDGDGNWIEGKKRIFKAVSPKSLPYLQAEVPDDQWVGYCAMMTNRLMGGMWGSQSDIDQIPTPFLYTMNIVYDKKLMPRIEKKCAVIAKQQRIGSWGNIIAERQSEFSYASSEIKKGTRFYRIIPTVWVYDINEQKVDDAANRVQRLWEGEGFLMQNEIGILPLLFTSSLPFGLRHIDKNVDRLDRDFIMTAKQFTPILPVQGDFIGNGELIIPFVGRKGQVGGLDIFHKLANSHNAVVNGETGAGKSVIMAYLMDMYHSCGAYIRVVEIGRSYKRILKILGGRHIEFNRESNISLNPYTHLNPEDFEDDISSVASVICQMIMSSTAKLPIDTLQAETVMTLIKNAIKWTWQREGPDSEPNTTHLYLKEYPHFVSDMDWMSERSRADTIDLAHKLAFNMEDFVGNGPYARWFNGKGNLDMANDELVCLELEDIRRQADLYNVVTLQVMNEMSMDLYLSDRTLQRILVFEEVAEYLRDNAMVESVVDALYRRARKYRGSAVTVMQSLTFLRHFGRVGDIIWNNSAFKFLLQGGDYETSKEDKRLADFSDFMMKILKSVQTKKRFYGEFLVSSAKLFGVGRIVLPPWLYFKYTSDATETAEIDALVSSGMTYEEACDEMVKKYRDG